MALTSAQAGHFSNSHHWLPCMQNVPYDPGSILRSPFLQEAFPDCHSPPGIFLLREPWGWGIPMFFSRAPLGSKNASDPPLCVPESIPQENRGQASETHLCTSHYSEHFGGPFPPL